MTNSVLHLLGDGVGAGGPSDIGLRRGSGRHQRNAARAEGRGVARGRAPDRARDQESADADRLCAPSASHASWTGLRAPEKDRILRECASIISREVESVKTLVDEFSQFARFPAAQPAAGDLNEVVENALRSSPAVWTISRSAKISLRACRR